MPFGIHWQSDGSLLYARGAVIRRITNSSEEGELVYEGDAGVSLHGPQMLPGDEWLLFSETSALGENRWNEGSIRVVNLATGETRRVVAPGSDARYVPTGHLVYALGNDLLAVPFDPDRLSIIGGARVVVSGDIQRTAVPLGSSGSGFFDFSASGTLVYLVANTASNTSRTYLAWVDASGRRERLPLETGSFRQPRLSPDGNRLVYETRDATGAGQVWVYDFNLRTPPRLIGGRFNNTMPIWHPDGERITFISNRDGYTAIYWQNADGSGDVIPLTGEEQSLILSEETGLADIWLDAWHPDGHTLLFTQAPSRMWALTLDDDGNHQMTRVFPELQEAQGGADFSPDGSWIAYRHNMDGRGQIIVRPWPLDSTYYQVTQAGDGGASPLWSPDGSRLFFRRGAFFLGISGTQIGIGQELLSIGINLTNGATPTSEQSLPIVDFPVHLGYRDYEIESTGERLLMPFFEDESGSQGATREIRFVLNWFEELQDYDNQ